MKKKLLLLGMAACAIAAVGTTWAAWVSIVRTGNEYMIPQYKTSLEEKFERPEDWQPGITTEKQVWVSNNVKDDTGESAVPVIAKVEIHQSWVRRENIYEIDKDGNRTAVPPLEGENLPMIFKADEDGSYQYAAIPNFNKDNVVVLRGSLPVDVPALGLDYVDDPSEAVGKWLIVNESPSEIGNFTCYFVGVLQPGEDSPVLLESVTMNPLLEATITTKDTYYEKDDTVEGGYRQITVTNRNSKYGYDGCRYTMDIKATTVQATKAAVEKTFDDGFYEKVIYYLANEVADPGVYDHSEISKRLTLVQRGSQDMLEYIPYRDGSGEVEEGNWFMSFTDMVPGGTYRDMLTVENTSSKRKVRIYMRIDPRQQEQIKDEVLEKITMRVVFDGEEIYRGKVTGAEYSFGEGNLQELIPLCYLSPGTSGVVQVEMVLDPDITCDPVTGACIYADQLAKIDWEFKIQVTTPGGGGGGGNTPGGGDPTPDPPGTSDPPGGGDTPDGGRDLTDLDGDGLPLGYMLGDPDVPLASLSRTGDSSRTMWYAAASVCSLLMMIVLGYCWKRERERQD